MVIGQAIKNFKKREVKERMITISGMKRHTADSENDGVDYDLKGLSTDTKPTPNTDPPLDVGINSLFLELDTGDFYYFDGTDWVKVGS